MCAHVARAVNRLSNLAERPVIEISMSAIRVGVIGAGENTRKRHIPGLQAIPGVTITHVANRTEASASKVAKEFGIPCIATDWKDLVNSPDIDAICIGTWPYTHAEMTIAALEKGKHVLCEARIAANSKEAEAMLATIQLHPHLVAQVVPSPLTLKFDKTIQNIISSRQLGDIVAIDVRGTGNQFVDFDAPLHWRQSKTFSGNNIMMMGIFYEALMRWVGEATSVMAMGKVVVTHRGGEEVLIPDHVDIICSMACGAQARMQFSTVLGHAEHTQDIWLFGTAGTLHLDITSSVLRVGERSGQMMEITVDPSDADSWRVEDEFVGAMRGTEKVVLTDFATALRYMVFTDAVTESLEQQRAVTVPQGAARL